MGRYTYTRRGAAREYPKAGFAIGLSNQRQIEERAQELFGERGEEPEGAQELFEEGFIDRNANLTKRAWEQLNLDLLQVERNVMRWLRNNFESAEDHGHDSHDDLVGWVWFNPRSKRQNLRNAEDRISIDDLMEGKVFIAWKGVSDLGQGLLNGDIFFDDIEGT